MNTIDDINNRINAAFNEAAEQVKAHLVEQANKLFGHNKYIDNVYWAVGESEYNDGDPTYFRIGTMHIVLKNLPDYAEELFFDYGENTTTLDEFDVSLEALERWSETSKWYEEDYRVAMYTFTKEMFEHHPTFKQDLEQLEHTLNNINESILQFMFNNVTLHLSKDSLYTTEIDY